MNGAKAPETSSPTLQEKTVTPETLPTVIGADEGYDGLSQVTVNPDAQLKAENIRSGKTIFGVEGVFEGSGSSSKLLESIRHCMAHDGGYVDELNTSDLSSDIGWSDVSVNSLMGMLQLGCCVKTLRVNDVNHGTITVYGSYKHESGLSKYTPTKVICETTNSSYNSASKINGVIYGLPEIPSGGSDRFLAAQIGATIIVDGGLVIDDTHWFNNIAYGGGFYYAYLRTIGANGTLQNPSETPIIHFRREVTKIMAYTFQFSNRFSVRFYADTPPALDSSVFSSDLVNLIVPKGKLEAYQNASGWSSYSSKIVEADE